MNLPGYLYHGSMFDIGKDPLKPGFYHTYEEVFWDGGLESNKYLYATTNCEEAVVLGIGSMIEKRFGLDHFQVDGKVIRVKGAVFTDKDQLKNELVYLYTLKPRPTDGWEKNSNPHNGIVTEWKTPKEVPNRGIIKVAIPVAKWLEDNRYTVHFSK